MLLKQARIDDLEEAIDRLNGELLPLKEFILPGGTKAAAYCHLARTVCRRAERAVAALPPEDQPGNENVIPWLNRLSDLLWLAARVEEKTEEAAG